MRLYLAIIISMLLYYSILRYYYNIITYNNILYNHHSSIRMLCCIYHDFLPSTYLPTIFVVDRLWNKKKIAIFAAEKKCVSPRGRGFLINLCVISKSED